MKEYLVIDVSDDGEICIVLQSKAEILDQISAGWPGFGGGRVLVQENEFPTDRKPMEVHPGSRLIVKGKCVAPIVTAAQLE